jgi:hypothetical protein
MPSNSKHLSSGFASPRAMPYNVCVYVYVCVRESVLFIGTQFSILYTSMYSPVCVCACVRMLYVDSLHTQNT